MPVAVECDLVTSSDDLGRERRHSLDLLSDEEERRPGVGPGERLENGRRSLAMWAVVERQCDATRFR